MEGFLSRLDHLSREEREFFVRYSPDYARKTGETEWLYCLLTSFEFMEVKVSMVGPQLLIDDYELSNDDDLRIIQDALRREAHVLTVRPKLFWQQLYNRLQWEEKINVQVLLKDELERRIQPDAPVWLRLKNPFRKTSALVRTLQCRDKVRACAISPDGSFIVSGSSDKTLTVWEFQTGKELATLEGHSAQVNACAISPDSSFIVSASDDHTLKVWDSHTWRERTTLLGHASEVHDCAISPDGSFIASVSNGHTLKIWETQTGRERATLRGHQDSVDTCAISPDGSFIVSGDIDRIFKIWDMQTMQERATLKIGGFWEIQTCAISPNGTYMICPKGNFISNEKEYYYELIGIWDTQTGMERAALKDDIDPHADVKINTCAISLDGAFIAAGSREQWIKVWDAKTGQMLGTLLGHTGPVTACAISPNGKFLISGSEDSTLKIWSLQTMQSPTSFSSHRVGVTACTISPDGTFAVSSDADSTTKIWDIQTGRERATLNGKGPGFGWGTGSCAISPDSSFIIVSAGGHDLEIWDTYGEQRRAALKGHENSIAACTISPDGSFIVSGSSDRSLTIWDVQTGEELAALGPQSVWDCMLSPDETFILSAGSSGRKETLKVWDVQTGEERYTLDGTRPIAVGPDGSFFASGSEEGPLKLWDTQSGQLRRVLREQTVPSLFTIGRAYSRLKLWDDLGGPLWRTTQSHTAKVRTCTISPDGTLIVTGSDDSTLAIWDVQTGQKLAPLRGHTGPVTTCAISPDGRFLVSGGLDKTLKVWDTKTGDERASISLPGSVKSIALHPWRFIIMGGDEGGNVYFIEPQGLAYGIPVATAVKRGNGIEARCPSCLHRIRLDKGKLGQEITCKWSGCGKSLRITPFWITIRTPTWATPKPPSRRRWWQVWRQQ